MRFHDRKAGFFSVLMITMFYIAGCSDQKERTEGSLRIDPSIAENKIYKQLDKEQEILSFGEDLDSFAKRTSHVAYSSREKKMVQTIRIQNIIIAALIFLLPTHWTSI